LPAKDAIPAVAGAAEVEALGMNERRRLPGVRTWFATFAAWLA
jgi:hypothetical protein